MSDYVLDENVLIVASRDLSPPADKACKLSAIEKLDSIRKTGVILIDENDSEILKIYRKRFSYKGQPTLGDVFLRHIYDNQSNPKYVKKISLNKNSNGDYEDFPHDPALKLFDKADRIFVALVKANDKPSLIINAVDSDYVIHKIALEKNGINVLELCLQCLEKAKSKKQSHTLKNSGFKV